MGGTVELTEDGNQNTSFGVRGVDPLLGKRLLHFRVIEEIGQGGMSVVYRGHDEQLSRDVAIKVLHPFLAQKSECRQRLAREARAVARLEHENILRIFAYSGDPPTLDETPDLDRDEPRGLERVEDTQEGFLVVEFVPGGTLKHWAAKNNIWDCPEIGALVVAALAKALAHAHAQGVIHRDLKPENVMIRDDGVVKLMDFGIAQVADAKSLTVTGTLLGSPAHMAPESIEGYPTDERSDIFSLGTVLYWLTTGRLPFEALTPHALLKAIVDGKRSPPQQHQPRISDELAKIIERSLATRPDDRYSNAEEMSEALDAYVEQVGLADVDVPPILADPPAHMEEVSQKVRARFLARAEELLEAGYAAKALGTLSRVLAEFPGDSAATALLERAHLNFDDESDPESEPDQEENPGEGGVDVDTEESLPVHLRRVRAEDALITAPTGAPRPDRAGADPITPRMLARRGALLAAIAGVLTLAVVVSNTMEPSHVDSEPAIAPPINGNQLVIDGPANGSPARDSITSETQNRRPIRTPKNRGLTTLVPRLRTPRLVRKGVLAKINGGGDVAKGTSANNSSEGTSKKDTENILGSETSPPDSIALTRTLLIRVIPWADIFVDGKRVAQNSKFAKVEVTPGHHVVKLTNLKAVDAIRAIDVPLDGHMPMIKVRLKPKPASLVVKANVDADVLLQSITGTTRRFVGTANQTRPIAVALDHSAQRAFDVVLYKSGYKSIIRRVTFAAGEATAVEVVLLPDPDGAPESGRRPIQPEQ